MCDVPRLIDERSGSDFRSLFGKLAARSSQIDVAATRIRLSAVDLRPKELGGVQRLRVLLAEVSAMRMAAEAESVVADHARAANLRLLIDLLEAGRIEVRSVPLGGWAPDFSVFHLGGKAAVALVGVHSFQRPSPFPGPILVSEHGPVGATLLASRFGEIWERAHDVSDAVRGLLARAGDGVTKSRVHEPVVEMPEGIAAKDDTASVSPTAPVDTPERL